MGCVQATKLSCGNSISTSRKKPMRAMWNCIKPGWMCLTSTGKSRIDCGAANDKITAGWGRDAALLAAPFIAPGLSSVSTKPPVPTYPSVPGLARVAKRASQPVFSSNEMIGKRMLTGNLLEDPDELTRMASIYKKHGILEEMAPWMNEAYAAKKRGVPDALHLLLNGDGKGAAEVLRNRGIKLADDPVNTNPDSPQSDSWRFRLEDGREKDINLKAVAKKFFPSSIFYSKD